MASQRPDIHASQAPKMYAIFGVFLVLPLMAVGLRLLARRVSHLGLWWDDWLILVATAMVVTNFAFLNETIKNGAGRHVRALSNPTRTIQTFQIYTFANEILYALIITLVQSSILCLYLRIFSINKAFARIVYSFLVLVLAWGIATLLTTIFFCSPVEAHWIASIPHSHCMNLRSWLVGTNVPHIVIDFAILLLPMPQIWQLKLARGRKVALSGVFLVGAFTSAVSIVRVIANSTIANTDPTWNYVAPMIWSTIEGNVGVVCACLPTLGVLIQPFFRSRSRSSYDAYALDHERSKKMPPRNGEFSRLEDTSGLVPKSAVLVESDILVERDEGDRRLGLDTLCVGREGGRSS